MIVFFFSKALLFSEHLHWAVTDSHLAVNHSSSASAAAAIFCAVKLFSRQE